MTFSPEYPPTGLAFYHDPAEDALFVAGVVEATSPGLNPWGAPEDGRDVRVWRYDLAARTWAVVVEYSSVAPGGPPPVHDFWGTMTAFPAGNRLHLCRPAAVAAGEAPPWAQCGGRGWAAPPAWTAPVRCSGGYACTRLSEWYSHCAPCHSGGDDSGDTPLYA
ncbi:hypothetical protein I4F81_010068 [Pyropia yezoensis]|uniref:Uncharacterized protein n=1 Tax=Pyropia yezoensis TaxID=2788 RepID=A0ACC3CBK8_PYRYE|nr:hypothetical protein I4F81_010068 [Neopyropia yezoensis]